MLLIRAEIRPSPIHGLGLFAVEAVAQGTPFWRFQAGFDHAMPLAEWERLPEPARSHVRWHGWLSAHERAFIRGGDHACFMNHAERPNTGALPGAEPPVTTVALRDIAAGEELTCDYRAFDADVAWKLGLAPRDTAPGAGG